MRDKVLGALLAEADSYISGSKIAKDLGMSRVAVWKHIEALKEDGYDIIGISGKGYKLENYYNYFLIDEIKQELKTKYLGKKIFYTKSVDSTNAWAKRHIEEHGVEEGSIFIAGQQSKGKARMGRQWSSPSGGLWFSLVLKPEMPLREISLLSLLFALAVSKAVDLFILTKSSIKWPNDILIDGKKLSGILLEASGELDSIESVIIGIGINVNNDLSEINASMKYEAIALNKLSNSPLKMQELFIEVVNSLDIYYEIFLKEGFKSIRNEFINKCEHIGKEIEITQGKKIIKGINSDIDERGILIIENADGISKISSGEIASIY